MSTGGIAVELDEYLAAKVKFAFDLRLVGTGGEARADVNVLHCLAEVRWGRSIGAKYRHGLALVGDGAERVYERLSAEILKGLHSSA